MQLITSEEVKNETGAQLEELLNYTPQQVNKWIGRQQKYILHYIADYAWGGMAQVECYLSDPKKRQAIKEALLEQIVFLTGANFVQGQAMSNKTVAANTRDIAPLAHDILEDNKLLYIGEWTI